MSESEFLLHADEIYNIMFFLPTEDVLRCMQVSKYWKEILLEEKFWKKYIRKRFNLKIVRDIKELEAPLWQWADDSVWSCYYKDQSDPYVARPFPTSLKCGVTIPFGLDLLSFDTKRLQGLSRSLEILSYMREGSERFNNMCGNECSPNEGSDNLSMVLIPWDGEELPTEEHVYRDTFHFHPEVIEEMTANTFVSKEKLYFHAFSDHDQDREEELCLNSVFGRYVLNENTQDEANFFAWVQNIMVPSCYYIAGDAKLNPVVHFFMTILAPGWVGGVLTGQCWT